MDSDSYVINLRVTVVGFYVGRCAADALFNNMNISFYGD